MKIKFNLKKVFYDNRILFFIALFASVLLWFIVVTQISPGYQRTIWSVPITVDAKDPTLAEHHLQALDKSAESVSIEVSGPRDQIGRLSAKDFKVTPVLTSVSGTGKYTLTLDKSLISSSSGITIVKVKPETVDISFDTFTTVSLPVSVQVTNGGAAQGFEVQTPVASPDQINITGPTGVVSKISKASVKMDVGANATDAVNTKGDIELLDSAGNVIQSPYIKLSSKTANISVQVYKKKDVPLKLSYFNIPAGYDQSNITATLSPAIVTLEGPANQIDSLDSLSISEVDFMSLNTTNHMTINFTLPKDLLNPGDVKTIDAEIDLKNVAAASLNVTSFNFVNLPAHHKAEVLTPVNNVKIFGPAAALSTLTGLSATVNLDGVTQSGTYSLPAVISLPADGCALQPTQSTVTVRVKYSY